MSKAQAERLDYLGADLDAFEAEGDVAFLARAVATWFFSVAEPLAGVLGLAEEAFFAGTEDFVETETFSDEDERRGVGAFEEDFLAEVFVDVLVDVLVDGEVAEDEEGVEGVGEEGALSSAFSGFEEGGAEGVAFETSAVMNALTVRESRLKMEDANTPN